MNKQALLQQLENFAGIWVKATEHPAESRIYNCKHVYYNGHTIYRAYEFKDGKWYEDDLQLSQTFYWLSPAPELKAALIDLLRQTEEKEEEPKTSRHLIKEKSIEFIKDHLTDTKRFVAKQMLPHERLSFIRLIRQYVPYGKVNADRIYNSFKKRLFEVEHCTF